MTEYEQDMENALGWAHERLQQILDKRGAGIGLDEADFEFLSMINRTENHLRLLGIDPPEDSPEPHE